MKNFIAIFWIFLAAFGRLIPHPPNFTPLTGLSLFSGSQLPKYISYPSAILALLCSDMLLSRMHGYEIFGMWSLFTYSGFLAVVWSGTKMQANAKAPRILGFTVAASLFYWIWTNFGIWLISYPKTFAGFVDCYGLALPFLGNSLLGDLIWTGVIFAGFSLVRRFTKTVETQSA